MLRTEYVRTNSMEVTFDIEIGTNETWPAWNAGLISALRSDPKPFY